ncbi:MAG: ABC transporter permease [Planctomycetota bacterium]|jgi:ABC-type transport system involved in multi-copper enzyme maturation permease subunit
MRLFLAMLKDSFREALDSKVFYVLAAFSLIFSISCLSIGLKNRPYEQALARVFMPSQWRGAMVDLGEKKPRTLPSPEMKSCTQEGEKLVAELEVLDLDKIEVLVMPFADMAGLEDFGGGNPDLETLKGQFGFRSYTARRLLMGGFTPSRIKLIPPAEGAQENLWRVIVHCNPAGHLRTAGAQSLTLFFGLTEISLGSMSGKSMILTIQGIMANAIGGMIGVLIAVVVTAWSIPNMLRKGSIDLILARPVSRWQVLVSRYLGGLVFVLMNSILLIGGTWLGLTIGTGEVHLGYLLCFVTITLLFAIVYSVSALAAVLFRNVVLSIVFAVGFWFFCYLITQWKNAMESPALNAMVSLPEWLKGLAKFFYYIFPSTSDLGQLNSYFMTLGEDKDGVMAVVKPMLEKIDFTGSIISSLIFTAVVVALSAWIFHRKDY